VYQHCRACDRNYDDAVQSTRCPHNPLDCADGPAGFCMRHDFRRPCPVCGTEFPEYVTTELLGTIDLTKARHLAHRAYADLGTLTLNLVSSEAQELNRSDAVTSEMRQRAKLGEPVIVAQKAADDTPGCTTLECRVIDGWDRICRAVIDGYPYTLNAWYIHPRYNDYFIVP
jgi:hypothetical protein